MAKYEMLCDQGENIELYESCAESTSEVKEEVKEEEDDEEDEDTISPFFFRLPNKIECAEYPNDVELETFRPTALINRNHWRQMLEKVEGDEKSDDSQSVGRRKRGGSQQENGRDAKRCKGGSTETGFPSPDGSSIKRGGSNGEIFAASAAKKSLKMKESSRTENGSAMTAVA
ncbi:hypothetical protein PRIPAC_85010 [Pristionchus pacificus]|uniref:Uncharacterized protein n=1 Tax=Pristionchus pacificus TaxID=54126 RepID=A0A2A6BNJ4_PRIPA|nr:hypothetical protein PRIPAC_85010 [Pristionchus pacificus]|eukprot:PDM67474.1 hypothetical protein PRIPAC_48891 [Pristionchus pacificus]